MSNSAALAPRVRELVGAMPHSNTRRRSGAQARPSLPCDPGGSSPPTHSLQGAPTSAEAHRVCGRCASTRQNYHGEFPVRAGRAQAASGDAIGRPFVARAHEEEAHRRPQRVPTASPSVSVADRRVGDAPAIDDHALGGAEASAGIARSPGSRGDAERREFRAVAVVSEAAAQGRERGDGEHRVLMRRRRRPTDRSVSARARAAASRGRPGTCTSARALDRRAS